MPVCRVCGASIDPLDKDTFNTLKIRNGQSLGLVCYDHDLDEFINDIMIVDSRIDVDQ